MFRCGEPGEALYLDHGLTDRDLGELSALFKRDAHDLWATHPRPGDLRTQMQGAEAAPPDLQEEARRQSSSREEGADAATTGFAQAEESHSDGGMGKPENEKASDERALTPDEKAAFDPASLDAADDETAKEWERISKRVEAEMRAQRHSLNGEGGLLQNLSIANRKPANYDEFLRRFATMAEDLRVSDEEFDYVYYTYGLSRYGNVPLVEPLEYQESKRVREFVIAIDTSGSCSGELVRTFVERTYDILRQQTSFGDRINVHLVQCDNRVRTATKVTSLAQLESYADSFWISGGGGTDFKPVFEYVDKLVEAGEFDDLRGLIYFTDGYGAFPTKAPGYEVAFVFVDDEDTSRKVPGWAMKVTMTQEEVLA